jgi:uncharacterized membrane protein YkgB
MKILFTILFLAAGAVKAQDYNAEHAVAQVVEVSPAITSVFLSNEGRLVIVQKNKRIQKFDLASSVKKELLGAVQTLSQAELEVETRDFVCMMMLPDFTLQNLKVVDVETNTMKLVLSNSACTEHEYVHPKESYILAQGQGLKSQMVILAKQLSE